MGSVPSKRRPILPTETTGGVAERKGKGEEEEGGGGLDSMSTLREVHDIIHNII